MSFTNYQKELVKEIQKISVNTRYPGNMTMSMNSFLRQLVESRNRVDKNCNCQRCHYMTMFS